MKTALALILVTFFFSIIPANAQVVSKNHGFDETKGKGGDDIDATSRFIFYSVLEGFYEDGVSNEDVGQILFRPKPKEDWRYYHFIYACPICTPAIFAFEAYQSRPKAFYSLKEGAGATFGHGLSATLHQQLFSPDPHQHLIAINTMIRDWMARRMSQMNLSSEDRAALMADLEQKRKQGAHMLQASHDPHDAFGKPRVVHDETAYSDLTECAVCNGAVGKPMKLPGDEKGK
jgi:hypothetical protein